MQISSSCGPLSGAAASVHGVASSACHVPMRLGCASYVGASTIGAAGSTVPSAARSQLVAAERSIGRPTQSNGRKTSCSAIGVEAHARDPFERRPLLGNAAIGVRRILAHAPREIEHGVHVARRSVLGRGDAEAQRPRRRSVDRELAAARLAERREARIEHLDAKAIEHVGNGGVGVDPHDRLLSRRRNGLAARRDGEDESGEQGARTDRSRSHAHHAPFLAQRNPTFGLHDVACASMSSARPMRRQTHIQNA